MKTQIKFIMHIMWYEADMVLETLASLKQAIDATPKDISVQMKFILNAQTYLETPNTGESIHYIYPLRAELYKLFPLTQYKWVSHLKDYTEVFYNIGDCRRDEYDVTGKWDYIVWGESDCLIPYDYFAILGELHKQSKTVSRSLFAKPHVVSLASRKMWDGTWDYVEHELIHAYPRKGPKERPEQAPEPYNCMDYITQEQLNDFNNQFDIKVCRLAEPKIDGALLALSPGLPQFIPDDLHFVREDTCAEQVFKMYNIPQFVISTRLKGHNYQHPKKRLNTNSKRTDVSWLQMEEASKQSINTFLLQVQATRKP